MWLVILGLVLFVWLLLTAIPLWVTVLAAVGFALPWLLVGVAVWAILSGGPGRRRRTAPHGPRAYTALPAGARQSHPAQRRPASHTRERQPQPPRPGARPALPIDVQVKVEQIRRKVELLLGYADRFPPFSADLYVVRRTAVEYLPRTVEAYLALPPDYAHRVLATTGKTALQELKEQLDLLDRKLDEIAEDLERRDLDRLLANRRFLEARFLSSGGAAQAGPPPARTSVA